MNRCIRFLVFYVLMITVCAGCAVKSSGEETIRQAEAAVSSTTPVIAAITSAPESSPAVAPPVAPPEAHKPVKIEFPALSHRSADILPVGLDQEGRMDTLPNADQIAWYDQSAVPGGQGNAILAGHRDWNGKLGLFRELEKLKAGDEVQVVLDNGERKKLQVASVQTFPLADIPDWVMSQDGEVRTTLITCAGRFIRDKGGYQSRVVVVLKSAA